MSQLGCQCQVVSVTHSVWRVVDRRPSLYLIQVAMVVCLTDEAASVWPAGWLVDFHSPFVVWLLLLLIAAWL